VTRAAIAIVLVLAGNTRADPPCKSVVLEAAAGVELAPLADDDLLERAAIAAAWRADRWQVGARVALAAGTGVQLVDEELVEGGVWLHASRRLDVLLAWRVGRAGFHFGYAFVAALALEPVAQLAIHVSPRLDVRIEPVAVHLYRSGVWQGTFGPQVGVAWRL